MIQQSIARRYARALFESVGSADAERVGKEIASIARALEESQELRDLFQDPRVDRATRTRILEQLIEASGFHPLLANMLRLLNDRNRLGHLPMIERLYRDLVDAQFGRLRARVTFATPLDPEVVGKIERQLGEATGKKVSLETAIDPSILGGIVAHLGNVVYDGSLRTQLELMRRELTERA